VSNLKSLTTGFLFKDVNLLIDSAATGVTDDIDLVLVVDPGLTDSRVWSGVLNLAARMAFEAVVEVPDEVAHHSDLALCVRAHVIMQKALADAVGKSRIRVVSRLDEITGRQSRAFVRI
jgi:hypothetical protein